MHLSLSFSLSQTYTKAADRYANIKKHSSRELNKFVTPRGKLRISFEYLSRED